MIMTKITKIDATMFFVQPKADLIPRTISMRKAERMGLHDAKVGEEAMLVGDESDVLVDVHRMGVPPQGHRLLAGKLQDADPLSGVIKIETSEGTQMFPVDSLAGSKLSSYKIPIRFSSSWMKTTQSSTSIQPVETKAAGAASGSIRPVVGLTDGRWKNEPSFAATVDYGRPLNL